MSLGRKLFTALVATLVVAAGLTSADAASAAPAPRVAASSHGAAATVHPAVAVHPAAAVHPMHETVHPASSVRLDGTPVAPGTISGTVKGADGPELESAYVEVDDMDGGYLDSTYTDEDGTYSFADLQPGKYLIFVSPNAGAYIQQWYNGKGSSSTATKITVTSSGISTADVTLAVSATISGTVVDASNQPLGDIVVTAYDAAGNYIENQWTAESDADNPGTYAFTDLVAGSYTLDFKNQGSGSYLEQWYSGKSSEATADLIVAHTGTVSTANATMAAAGTINGKITGADTHLGVAEVGITATPVGGGTSYFGATLDDGTDPDTGTYSLTGLPSGTYNLYFSAYGTNYLSTYYNNKATAATATTVTVTAGASPAIANDELAVGGTISGSITGAPAVSGGTPVPIIHGVVSVYSTTGANVGSFSLDSTDSYSITALPTGHYTLLVEYTGVANYLDTWWSGASKMSTATSISVTAGAVTTVNPVLRLGGTITGTVTDATTHLGIAGVRVSSPCDTVGLVCTRPTATTDSNGNYSLAGFGSGSALLSFVDTTGAHAYQWYNNKTVESAASGVAVSPGHTTPGINAALVAAGSISGTVTPTGSGTGLEGIEVDLYDSTNTNVGTQYTDGSGNYTFAGLAAGGYRLEFNANGDSEGLYAFQWYNGAVLRSHSTTVVVAIGEDIGNIDASLVTSVDVSGVISDSQSGNGLNTIEVDVMDADGSHVATAGTWGSNDGGYSISGLAAGSYTLQFIDTSTSLGAHAYQWYNDKTRKSQANPITVGGTDVTANAALHSGGSIAGGIANLPSDSTIEITVYDTDLNAVGWSEASPSGNTYSIVGLPTGNYTMKLHDDGGNFPDQWLGGGAAAGSGTVIAVTGGSTTTVNPTLTSKVISSAVPTITGTATFGQTLTEHPGTWGPSPVALTEKWLRDGTTIPGATSTTYALTAADVGHQLSVKVTGTKSGYATVDQTSELTSSVIGATLTGATPTVSGNTAVGQVLTATPGTWGPGTVALTYQWNDIADGAISGATSSTFTPNAGYQNHTLTVTVTGTKAGYNTLQETSLPTGTIGAAYLAITPGSPTISGTPTVGQTLTSVAGDEWSPNPETFSYQWKRSGTNISSATKSTYKLTSSDAGKAITVTLTAHRSLYLDASATAGPVTIGKAITKSPTPKISGSALVGSKLTASAGTWSPSSVSKHYQWNSNGTAIVGATKSTYTPVTADGGTTMTVTVTGTKTGYTPISKTSTAKAIPLQLTVTPAPTISGSVLVGQTLTAVPGTWAPTGETFTYEWKRSGAAISHATGATYKLTSSDAGKAITVKVTGSLAGYQSVPETSAPVTPPKLLTASPIPKITGTGVAGSVLKVSAGTWSPSTVTLSYQWNLDGTPIDGATLSTYTPNNGQAGSTITVTVTGSKTGYASISRTSTTGKLITGAP